MKERIHRLLGVIGLANVLGLGPALPEPAAPVRRPLDFVPDMDEWKRRKGYNRAQSNVISRGRLRGWRYKNDVEVGSTSRTERRTTGISARQQRRRRIDRRCPVQYGTRRGLRRYLNVLVRGFYLGGDRKRQVTQFAATHKPSNRTDKRWMQRWWDKEEEAA